jgi:pimeloyl-ACP methyl ester carboxylesterase
MELAMARRLGSDADQRIGSLVVNPGGPGASGIEFLEFFAQIAPATLVERFDLISWDPRGVGGSRGLRCNDNIPEDLNYAATLEDGVADDIVVYVEDLTRLGADCLAMHPDLLDHVGTVATARDLNQIRRAINDDALSYLGFSYGTRIGAVYATLFPDHVRAMVLDGAFPPGLSPEELASADADLEATLVRIDRVCELEPTCSVADPGVVDTVAELLDDLSSEARETQLGLSERSSLIGATLLAIYAPGTWQEFTNALGDARNASMSAIDTLARRWLTGSDGDFDDIFRGSNIAIMCADRAYATNRTETLTNAHLSIDAAPILGELLFGASCEGWPVDGEPLPSVATDGAPTLMVIGGTHDPATPLRWAQSLADDIADAVLVTYVGDGHTAASAGNRCVDDLVVAYLIDLEIPRDAPVCRAPTGVLGVEVSLDARGIAIRSVVAGSPADGILSPGDIIVTIDDERAISLDQLATSAEQKLSLDVDRGGERVLVDIVAGRQPWTLGE